MVTKAKYAAMPQDLTEYHAQLWQCAREAEIGDLPAFPVADADADTLFQAIGYVCNAELREQAFGESKPELSLSDFRTLHLKLEGWKCWKSFPNPTHDAKKAVTMIAFEIAAWWHKAKPHVRTAWLEQVAPEMILGWTASSIDQRVQLVWLEISLRKFGLAEEVSDRYQG